MAAYIGVVFYATMVMAALVMDVAFSAARPGCRRITSSMQAEMTHFSMNYTFWLNGLFGVIAVVLFLLARRAPVQRAACAHHGAMAHHH